MEASYDDLGDYVSLDYSAPQKHKWRIPFGHKDHLLANLNMADYSNPFDDQGSYSWGEKEVEYLTTIETKTHRAVFTTSDREDGMSIERQSRRKRWQCSQTSEIGQN